LAGFRDRVSRCENSQALGDQTLNGIGDLVCVLLFCSRNENPMQLEENKKGDTAMTIKTPTTTSSINGVDRERLFQTIDLIKAKPGLGKFNFRIRNQWLECGHNRSTVHTFSGAGADNEHAMKFELDADEPAILLGKDQGANPVEYLLHALAACVTTSMVYHAAAKGITIEEVESSIDGDIDLRGFLGLDKNVRNGYEQIRMNFKNKADVSEDELQELCMLGPQYSPVFDSVTKGVPIKVSAERMP
jgi:uncharacterized OsmC-like protein